MLAAIANNLSRTLIEQGKSQEALRLLVDNIDRCEGTDDLEQLSITHNHLGQFYADTDGALAEEHFEKDVAICRELGDAISLFDALDTLGSFLCDQRRIPSALRVHREAVNLCEEFFDLRRHGRGLANLGRCQFVAAQQSEPFDWHSLEEARSSLDAAAARLSSVSAPQLYAPTLENLGRVQFFLNLKPDAVKTLGAAITEYDRFAAGRESSESIREELEELEQ